jgi:hypothetical protein
MMEINNQGINNYLAQQTSPQVAEQTTTQTAPVQEKQATQAKEERKTEERGVILEISREARNLSKANLNDEALEAIMINRKSKANLQVAIMEAKQHQENVTEKVSQMIEVAEDRSEPNAAQTIAA